MPRLAASSLALILLITLTIFPAPVLRAQTGDSDSLALTPVEETVPPESLPTESATPAESAVEPAPADTATLPPAALDALELQAAGDERWDDRFATPGTTDEVTVATVAPDGTLYAVLSRRTIVRWDGRAWRDLGQASFEVSALAILNGQLYAAGDFNQIGASNVRDLARYDGTRWLQVGSGVGPQRDLGFGGELSDGRFYSLAVVGNTLYVGGDFNLIDGVSANNIAAWNGTSFSPLGQGVRAIDFQGDPSDSESASVRVIEPAGGKLYVGGVFGYAGNELSGSVGVWDGTSWSSLGGGVLDDTWSNPPEEAQVNAIAVNGANVYVGGRLTLAGRGAGQQRVAGVAHWNGTSWSNLDGGVSGQFASEVYALHIDNNQLYVGGEFDGAGGAEAPALARWNGTAWQAFGALETSDTVHTIARIPTGGLFIGGQFDLIGGVSAHHIVRYSGGAFSALGAGLTSTETSNCCAGEVNALIADGAGRIYAGGRFKTAGGVIVNNIARWDGTRWQALGAGVSGGDVNALALAGETLYVGGAFTGAGGQAISYIARYNTRTGAWSGLGSGVNGEVNALDYADGILFVGGDFDLAGGLDVYDVAFWDGTRWGAPSDDTRIYQVFDTCNEAGSQVYTLKASGRYLVVGGNFRLVLVNPAAPCSTASYRQANNLLLYDLVDDAWFFVGSNNTYGVSGGPAIWPGARALAVVGPSLEDGGTLYVGGDFGQAGSVASPNLARFTLQNGWAAAGGTSGDSGGALPDRGVYALQAAGGSLYVAGNFKSAGNATAASVARYDLGTNSWSALGSGVSGSYGTAQAIAVAPDGLFVGGRFEQAGGKPAAGVARWAANPTRGTIGTAGGNLGADGANLTFPAGAVPADTAITITPLLNAPAQAPAGQGIARSFRFNATRGGQPVTDFAKPYTLRVSYSQGQLTAAGISDPASLKLAYWDGQKWVTISGAKVDTAARTITASVDHFSDFALIGTLKSGGQSGGAIKVYLPALRK